MHGLEDGDGAIDRRRVVRRSGEAEVQRGSSHRTLRRALRRRQRPRAPTATPTADLGCTAQSQGRCVTDGRVRRRRLPARRLGQAGDLRLEHLQPDQLLRDARQLPPARHRHSSQLVRVINGQGSSSLATLAGASFDPHQARLRRQNFGGILGRARQRRLARTRRTSRSTRRGGALVQIVLERPRVRREEDGAPRALARQGIQPGTPAFDQILGIVQWILDPADPANVGYRLTHAVDVTQGSLSYKAPNVARAALPPVHRGRSGSSRTSRRSRSSRRANRTFALTPPSFGCVVAAALLRVHRGGRRRSTRRPPTPATRNRVPAAYHRRAARGLALTGQGAAPGRHLPRHGGAAMKEPSSLLSLARAAACLSASARRRERSRPRRRRPVGPRHRHGDGGHRHDRRLVGDLLQPGRHRAGPLFDAQVSVALILPKLTFTSPSGALDDARRSAWCLRCTAYVSRRHHRTICPSASASSARTASRSAGRRGGRAARSSRTRRSPPTTSNPTLAYQLGAVAHRRGRADRLLHRRSPARHRASERRLRLQRSSAQTRGASAATSASRSRPCRTSSRSGRTTAARSRSTFDDGAAHFTGIPARRSRARSTTRPAPRRASCCPTRSRFGVAVRPTPKLVLDARRRLLRVEPLPLGGRRTSPTTRPARSRRPRRRRTGPTPSTFTSAASTRSTIRGACGRVPCSTPAPSPDNTHHAGRAGCVPSQPRRSAAATSTRAAFDIDLAYELVVFLSRDEHRAAAPWNLQWLREHLRGGNRVRREAGQQRERWPAAALR